MSVSVPRCRQKKYRLLLGVSSLPNVGVLKTLHKDIFTVKQHREDQVGVSQRHLFNCATFNATVRLSRSVLAHSMKKSLKLITRSINQAKSRAHRSLGAMCISSHSHTPPLASMLPPKSAIVVNAAMGRGSHS